MNPLNQTFFLCIPHQFGSTAQIKLGSQIRAMVLDSTDTDMERLSDLTVSISAGNEPQDFDLSQG
jgi:hypothetical protein